MGVDQARRLKELERENSRLKTAVADLTLDNLILKEASEGNFSKHRANKEMRSTYAAEAGNI